MDSLFLFFFIPTAIIALPTLFLMWKLWEETEVSGRGWMKFAVVWSMPFTVALFASLFHVKDGAELLPVVVVHLLVVTCILRRVNKKAG